MLSLFYALLGYHLTNLIMSDGDFATDYKITSDMPKFLGIYEAYHSRPYVVKGENFYTIGIGSTRIFSNDGKTSRKVVASDRLTYEQAMQQVLHYYNNAGSPKVGIDNIIKKYGFKLHKRFYDMLCQFSYASGSFHRKASFLPIYISMLQRANGSTDVKMLGDLIQNTWISYLKANANYTLYGLGWSRRAYAGAQYVKGLPYDKITVEKVIKKPF